MSSINRIIVAPRHFKANSIITFINDCQIIYSLTNKMELGFLLDLSKVVECTMIGVLLVYKTIEFTFKNKCFNGPSCIMSPEFDDALLKYGFTNLVYTYLRSQRVAEKEFSDLKVSISDSFIIAPQALLRNDKYSSELLNKKYLPQIECYYAFNPKTVKMIFLCFSEILLNFWEHAVDDTQSIIVANGNKGNIEIACADNGKGVLSTLSLAGKTKKNELSTFLSAIEKGVTSKELTNHMGYGLWIIDEVVKRTNGRFHLYSEGFYYQRDFKTVRFGKCGHWQGAVVYLSLPTDKPITLSDIESPENNSNFNLHINWV